MPVKESNITMAVFLHIRTSKLKEGKEINTIHEFARIPIVGEYIMLPDEKLWFKIVLVVHTPSAYDYNAEVYAVGVNHLEVLRTSGY